MASAPPPLEDTLVSGYTRLASQAEHRGIDLELRLLDILFAGIFGILLAPVGLLIAGVLLVTTGRPILYRGERVGRQRIGPAQSIVGLPGLGLPGYQTAGGMVIFLKDAMTLQVDATALPEQVGPNLVSRTTSPTR